MKHIGSLDGLRGLAALWVLLGHACLLSRFNVPILARPGNAVDLFMILSGFLMMFHYGQLQGKNAACTLEGSLSFWVRRFFRIVPAYYLVLLLSFSLIWLFGWSWRFMVASVYPGEGPELYAYTDGSAINLFLHFVFAAGLFPYFSLATALPDWSISLEMQFYLIFPLVLIGFVRCGVALSPRLSC